MTKINVHPKKSLGQNFLMDENISRKIVSSLDLDSGDYVLEIGAGVGALTAHLVSRAKQVVAVEIDRNLVEILTQKFDGYGNLILLHDDILKISWHDMLAGSRSWKMVANLPYHITSPVIFKLLDHQDYFRHATLMVQKEVAERLVAGPGSKAYGILSVICQLYAEIRILFDVSQHVFFPKPGVTSAVIRLDFQHDSPLAAEHQLLFREVVRGVFNQRRKVLRNSLRSRFGDTLDLSRLDFDLSQRPENIDVSGFVDLTTQIATLLSRKR